LRLERFQLKNYRSIKSTRWISLESSLTVIGPNNEGKSNLVRALVTSLQLLEELASAPRSNLLTRSRIRRVSRAYQWEQDCPLDLQTNANSRTEFKLEFSLNDSDINEFYSEIGSSINNKLPITISIGRNGAPEFEVNKPGKGYAVLSGKSARIGAFIGSRLSINYIPAVRTARDSARSVETLVSAALRQVERTPEYRDALQTIEDLQRPVLNDLEERLGTTLKKFLPNLKGVSLDLQRDRNESFRSVNVSIDDGQLTSLASKGDGVISLVGMALLARLEAFATSSITMILAIEEPESHLHPRAIHAIRSILDNLGEDLQVIVTTHSPALVNRIDLGGNILVENNKANVVSDIAEVRDALGVRISDNLQNSRLVVICEGTSDDKALAKLLSELSPRIAEALKSAEVAITPLRGSGNLSYMASTLQNSICEPVCFLDDDHAGNEAMKKAIGDEVLTDADIVLASRIGKKESEFEDLVLDDILEDIVQSKYKADLKGVPNSMRSRKFTDRAKGAFEKAGRPWNNAAKIALKQAVGEKCSELGLKAISPDKMGPLKTLVALIEERLG
jgi:putative ATP-dependent endonuclease of the OLD family